MFHCLHSACRDYSGKNETYVSNTSSYRFYMSGCLYCSLDNSLNGKGKILESPQATQRLPGLQLGIRGLLPRSPACKCCTFLKPTPKLHPNAINKLLDNKRHYWIKGKCWLN